MHAKNSEKVPLTLSAVESAVLETILPKQKKEKRLIHAKNSEKVLVTSSAEESVVLETTLLKQKKRSRE